MVTFFKWVAVVITVLFALLIPVAIQYWDDPNSFNPIAGTGYESVDGLSVKVKAAIFEGIEQIGLVATFFDGIMQPFVKPEEEMGLCSDSQGNTNVEQEKIR